MKISFPYLYEFVKKFIKEKDYFEGAPERLKEKITYYVVLTSLIVLSGNREEIVCNKPFWLAKAANISFEEALDILIEKYESSLIN